MPVRYLTELVMALLLQSLGGVGQTGRVAALVPEPEQRIWIPAGEFLMGSTQRDLRYATELCQRESPRDCDRLNFHAETPPHRVRTRGFSIDRFEVSTTRYEACVRAGACRPRAHHRPDQRLDGPDLPVVDVSWHDAVDYCRWRGGRLPTEAEWERAARGPTSRRFPWGDLWNGALCNHGGGLMPHVDPSDGARYLAPVTAYPASRSPYGLYNVAGNVWEWVHDWYDDQSYQRGRVVADPVGPAQGRMRVLRGGSWATPPFTARATTRGHASERERAIDIGFRCSWDRE